VVQQGRGVQTVFERVHAPDWDAWAPVAAIWLAVTLAAVVLVANRHALRARAAHLLHRA
jgi:hypothetical protein